jgi:hypothetical protein
MKATYEAPTREMTEFEKRQIVQLIEEFAKVSFGKRIDANHFDKNGAWEELSQTPAYDEFLWGLFEPDPNEALNFLVKIMPKDFQEQGLAELKKSNPEVAAAIQTATHISTPDTGSVEPKPVSEADVLALGTQSTQLKDDRPAWVRENREPTLDEFKNMTREEQVAEYARKASAR